jgi:cysteinyl-tRNA synthetase
VRYLFGQTHYRKQLDWSDDALAAATAGVRRLRELTDRLARGGGQRRSEAGQWMEATGRLREQFQEAMDDDLNVPGALAAVMEFVREANGLLDLGIPPGDEPVKLFDAVTGVLQVVPEESHLATHPYWKEKYAEAVKLADERRLAKEQKDYKKADELRMRVMKLGFWIKDNADGSYELTLRPPGEA